MNAVNCFQFLVLASITCKQATLKSKSETKTKVEAK